MERRTLLSAAFLLLLAAVAADFGARALAQADSARLRVMTFNIRYNNPNDKENSWPYRKEMAASMIRFHRADLVGLQEALDGQIEDLAALLPEYGHFGVGRDDGKKKGEYTAIFFRRDRLDRLDGATFWLSETPEVAGSKSWDAAITRIVTWSRFRDRRTKREFYHFNTHFDHRGVEARKQSAQLLLSRIPQIAKGARVILTGDFNTRETDDPYRILTGDAAEGGGRSAIRLRDARKASRFPHHGPTSTFHGFKSLVPGMLIDFIFVGDGIRVWQHGALFDAWDGRFPSDHLPVLAEVEFE